MKSSGPHAHKVQEESGPQLSSPTTISRTHVFLGLRQRQEVGLHSVYSSSMDCMVGFSFGGGFSQSGRCAFGFEARFGGSCVDLFLPLPLPLLLLRYLSIDVIVSKGP